MARGAPSRPLPGMARLAAQGLPAVNRMPAGALRGRTTALEDELAFQVRALGLPEPVRELRFAADIGRKWRFDLAWPAQRLAVEVQGGGFVAGRHGRGLGLEADAEKLSNAVLLGWRVLLCTGAQIRRGEAVHWVWSALGGGTAVVGRLGR